MVKGIPADELARAKDDIALQFPKTFEATGRISSRLRALESLLVYGLPDDYYANYATAIQAVGAARRPACGASNTFDPDHLTIVIVGDRKTIEPPDPRAEPRIDQGDEHRRGVCAGEMTAERDHTLQK